MTDYNDQGNTPATDRLLAPAEVAKLLRVSTKTPSRWAIAGKLPSTKTPGGHRRFREADVLAILNGAQS